MCAVLHRQTRTEGAETVLVAERYFRNIKQMRPDAEKSHSGGRIAAGSGRASDHRRLRTLSQAGTESRERRSDFRGRAAAQTNSSISDPVLWKMGGRRNWNRLRQYCSMRTDARGNHQKRQRRGFPVRGGSEKRGVKSCTALCD